jgi:GT2 family glycosyltransferase
VAAVVLARDRASTTARTLDALLAQEPPPDVLILVGNDPTEDVVAVMRDAAARHADAEVITLAENTGGGGGFAGGLRAAMERADVDLVCAFDDDALPLPGCLAALTAAATSLPRVGSVGAVSHDVDGTLAWPMYVSGRREPLRTMADVLALAAGGQALPVHNFSWHGLMFPAANLRAHGNVWSELYHQFEDMEFGLRLSRAGLTNHLVPQAEVIHPAGPAGREVRVLGRSIQITAQNPVKEYLTLRNGLAVWRRHGGRRFWPATAPLILLRGLLSALALDCPRRGALREVFLQGARDGLRGRLGPPPAPVVSLAERCGSPPPPGSPRAGASRPSLSGAPARVRPRTAARPARGSRGRRA